MSRTRHPGILNGLFFYSGYLPAPLQKFVRGWMLVPFMVGYLRMRWWLFFALGVPLPAYLREILERKLRG